MNLFLTSWHRWWFTWKALERIKTVPQLGVTVWDNGSEKIIQENLVGMAHSGFIQTLILNQDNLGCRRPKVMFHQLAQADGDEFYLVTDNDFLCPEGWSWIEAMLSRMRQNPRLAMLTPQYWPQWPMGPFQERDGVVLCKAVGNTFKLVRAAAVTQVLAKFAAHGDDYGDDGILCQLLRDNGWDVGFCTDVFCYNLELGTKDWGYLPHQLKQDPRKAGYAPPPEKYEPKDWNTLELPEELKWKPN